MFFVLDTYSHNDSDVFDLIVHRSYPGPCLSLPESQYQIQLGDHEDALTALYRAKKIYPSKTITFCNRCYGNIRKLSLEELDQLNEIFN